MACRYHAHRRFASTRMSHLCSPCLIRLLASFSLLAVGGVEAQCETVWLPSGGRLGADSLVHGSIAWDPDGAGPQDRVLVIGGDFTIVANVVGNHVAMFDPATDTWSPLGNGFEEGRVNAFCVLASGDLVTGGFSMMFGSTPFSLARWNGTNWIPYGPGFWNEIIALAAEPNGRVVAGGWQGIWEFDLVANTWTSIGSGWPNRVTAMVTLPNGNVAIASNDGAGGNFLSSWNGASFSLLATGLDGRVTSLDLLPNGDLLACGDFTMISGVDASHLARWDGTWHPVAPGLGAASVAEVMANGDIVVTGFFTSVGGVPADYIARWNGSTWSPLQLGLNGRATGLTALPSGDLFATVGWGGGFNTAGGLLCYYVAHYDGTSWPPVGGTSPDGRVNDCSMMPGGDIVAVGYFDNVGFLPAPGVARWHQGCWLPMASGFSLAVPLTVQVLANGDVLAGGYYGMQRWSGTSWVSAGFFGANGIVRAVLELANGDVIAAGNFASAGGVPANNIARWDGVTWSALGGFPSEVNAVAQLPNGDLIAASKHVYRWNGTSWSLLGAAIGAPTSVGGATSLIVHPGGDLLAAGELTLGSVARWNGTAWSALGASPQQNTQSIAALPNGDVVACGWPWGYATSPILSRWNGTAWTAMAASFTSAIPGGGPSRVRMLPNHELAVAGAFTVVNSQCSPNFARLGSTCPALAQGYGSGCSGSSGPVHLTVDALPWLGGSFRATTVGAPAVSLAVGVGGFYPLSMPLPAILPQGIPGCELLATPDALYLLVPSAGEVHSEIPIPATPLYLQKQFFYQVVILEFDPTWAILAATSSNAVELRVGLF